MVIRWADYHQKEEIHHPRGLEADEVHSFMEALRDSFPERLRSQVYPVSVQRGQKHVKVEVSVHADAVQEVVAYTKAYTASASCELRGVRTRPEDPPEKRAASALMGKFIGFVDGFLTPLVQKGAFDVMTTVDWRSACITIEGQRNDNKRELNVEIGRVQGTAVSWHSEFLSLVQMSRLQLNHRYKEQTNRRRN